MAQVGAYRVRAAVDELHGQVELVEGLIPELLLGLRAEHAIPRARHRRSDHERPRPFGKNAGDGLGDTAADVIAGQYRAAQA